MKYCVLFFLMVTTVACFTSRKKETLMQILPPEQAVAFKALNADYHRFLSKNYPQQTSFEDRQDQFFKDFLKLTENCGDSSPKWRHDTSAVHVTAAIMESSGLRLELLAYPSELRRIRPTRPEANEPVIEQNLIIEPDKTLEETQQKWREIRRLDSLFYEATLIFNAESHFFELLSETFHSDSLVHEYILPHKLSNNPFPFNPIVFYMHVLDNGNSEQKELVEILATVHLYHLLAQYVVNPPPDNKY